MYVSRCCLTCCLSMFVNFFMSLCLLMSMFLSMYCCYCNLPVYVLMSYDQQSVILCLQLYSLSICQKVVPIYCRISNSTIKYGMSICLADCVWKNQTIKHKEHLIPDNCQGCQYTCKHGKLIINDVTCLHRTEIPVDLSTTTSTTTGMLERQTNLITGWDRP